MIYKGMFTSKIITATLGALITIGLLCSLGYWQVKRLAWKDAIIAELDALYAQEANTTPVDFSVLLEETEPALHYGYVEGQFDFDKEIALEPKILQGAPGYHILTPLITKEGHTILVNRGWSKDKDETKETQALYKVSGIVRKPDWTAFTSENSSEADRWFRADIQEIGRIKDLQKLVPYVLYAENMSPALEGTVLQAKKWYPKNNHKPYAIFWFSMAGIACVFYVAFIRVQLRERIY